MKKGITSILFSNDEKIVESMRGEIVYSGGKEQEVVLINEKTTISKHETKAPTSYEIARPLTSVVG